MWLRKIYILIILLFIIFPFVPAQQNKAKTDSSEIYRDIETFSKKRKSTNFIYGIFFKPVDIPIVKKLKVKKKIKQKTYADYEGKIVREIYITTLDPFGYKVADTSVSTQHFLYRMGNKMHIKTLRLTIQNLLLIHKNDSFDSFLVKESERLIRSQKYVHDVSFTVVSASKKSDSVDIYIRELDIWTIIPDGSISTSNFSIGLTDINFLGTGHNFQNTFSNNFENGIYVSNTNYYIPNIRNTYINSTIHFDFDGYNNYKRGFAIDRPFFSPIAKWAAGASIASQNKGDSLLDISQSALPLSDTSIFYIPLNSKFNTQDFWAGYAYQIFRGNKEEERATNLILAMRYLHIGYLESPSELYDPLHVYSSENFYVAGLGISTRQYVQDKFVFNYGITEDVPVGKVIGITAGIQKKNNIVRNYYGVRLSMGNYYPWGYVSANIEYGSFWHKNHSEQGVFTVGVNYFTNLLELGNWKIRQFAKPLFTIGINRFPSETLSINNENGIQGFNSISLQGTKKMVLTLQTQTYAPWNLLGFRFGPYFVCSFGMLGNASDGFTKGKLYSQFGFGLLIKNEFLVYSNFQISLSFYPSIPGMGDYIYKMNTNNTTDFGFRDFELGKPETVRFR